MPRLDIAFTVNELTNVGLYKVARQLATVLRRRKAIKGLLKLLRKYDSILYILLYHFKGSVSTQLTVSICRCDIPDEADENSVQNLSTLARMRRFISSTVQGGGGRFPRTVRPLMKLKICRKKNKRVVIDEKSHTKCQGPRSTSDLNKSGETLKIGTGDGYLLDAVKSTKTTKQL